MRHRGRAPVRWGAFHQRPDPPLQIRRVEQERQLGSEELDLFDRRIAGYERVGSRHRAIEMPFEHVEPAEQAFKILVRFARKADDEA